MSATIFVLDSILALASAHGYLKWPVALNAIQILPGFNPVFNTPYFWSQIGVWCGGVHQDMDYSTADGVVTRTVRLGSIKAENTTRA